MKWSEDQTYQFVKTYLKHVHLWNTKHPDYKAMNLRMKSYRDIINEFRETTGINLNMVELKIKIKNLRSTYTQELAKIKRRSSPECTFRSSLKWFTLWHKRFANIRKDEIETSYDQQDPIEESSEVWVSHTNNLDSNIDPFQDNEDYNSIVLKVEPNDFYKIENSNQCKVKKKKAKLRSPSVEFSDRTFRGSMDSSDLAKEDEFDIYGKYIASQLRKMDVQKALRVQLEIQSLVSEARILDLTNKH
ncbi:uncharacterized protein LOC115452640 [Manduca sexta]|uniref:MADF domain-containing protein n=1 Tax=Manduca sexta TaxID=7130 RepID=A0A921ZU05_MANSE|nr:uncharacterized protein LOC115452640 [Manduca sexta]KAG6463861.1 hypothetical protein O3G_MSEX014114 [Manduca sexta]